MSAPREPEQERPAARSMIVGPLIYKRNRAQFCLIKISVMTLNLCSIDADVACGNVIDAR
jgi:hypothetical protein